jgi:hypothetical protein
VFGAANILKTLTIVSILYFSDDILSGTPEEGSSKGQTSSDHGN